MGEDADNDSTQDSQLSFDMAAPAQLASQAEEVKVETNESTT